MRAVNAIGVWSALVRYAFGLLAWMIALYGVLNVTHLDLPGSHLICGRWGCGPPLSALVACHGFWVVMLTPIVVLTGKFTPSFFSSIAGWTLTTIGCLSIVGVVVWQALDWLPQVSSQQGQYFAQRSLFVVATFVEAPMVQLILAGVGLIWFASGKRRRKHSSQQ